MQEINKDGTYDMLYEDGERYRAVEREHLFFYRDVRPQIIEYQNSLREIQAQEENNEDNNSTCHVM